ncbi:MULTISPECIES: sensor histidine kinase [unclassified Paracoccus (in: a-proteobacteria)]|uniref:sensor histidine kinase n=1 Tax=unclassified Paracoccus (in: a-proteobacteria) TaxID=2688777 RepID=UPI001E38C4E7|nr:MULTISPECIES: HAMP domain-containing sensor histidine kinase [unclassified Paracoccus (in: a-proteobacteria)]UXU74412.1 HAMP domain-containing histidine kinase [Paracoccus sp. SMMA_5]UXU80302.1 HAMP domain-containing histidine kinase [Paracoccus sp. SMMA_5_TC]
MTTPPAPATRRPALDHPWRLLRSTPVRLALGLVALFSMVSMVTLGVAFAQIRSNLTSQIAASLDQHVAGFRVTSDARTLAALVAAEAAAADPQDRIFVFIAPGAATVGNARAQIIGTEVRLSRPEGGRELGVDGYETRVVPMAGGLLVIGESLAPLKDLEETLVDLVAFSLAPTVLLSLAAGVWLAAASARRVGRIETALERMASGDLTARVRDRDRGDDLSRIGAGIDRMAAAQEAATAALRQVSADIAHDLKTPVQRMAVLLADLRDRLPEQGVEADLAARAADEADRAVAVFQSLLQIAQIEGGSPKARFAPVDLAEVARTFAEIYEPAAEDSGHRLHLAPVPTAALTVNGDRTLIGQALANLIENALRHCPPGATITLSLSRHSGRVDLVVADNGPGIPADEHQRVLRRLYRLERSRTTPGHGLGLAMVAAIAEAHGADLTLSDNAPGLRATLSFPETVA